MIESIDGAFVTLERMGTFSQTDKDPEAKRIRRGPEFEWTGSMTVSLSFLWSYIHSNTYEELTKPEEKVTFPPNKTDDKEMSWWNIFKHAHSFGTILHGDLWKWPWKAFEEQHHKDHAFAGKITAALAMEKAQKIPGIGWFLFDHDWANLMIGDANNTFQSYLDELVDRIEGMGSAHRSRLIKKWSKLHFPDPKFMAAQMASMKIFGHLYPAYMAWSGDYETWHGHGEDKKGTEWFWYNSMMHTGAFNHLDSKKYPHHMPVSEDKWPKDAEGNLKSEIQVCYELYNAFKHPMLKNLSRRFQKYMKRGMRNSRVEASIISTSERVWVKNWNGWWILL